MTKLGELLKSEREKRGLSLHEIGMNIKINPKFLKAIEEGDQPNLPAKTFLRGFVKSYAQFLRLDIDQTLQMFQEEYGAHRPAPPASDEGQKSATSPTGSSQTGQAPRFENSLKRPDDSALPTSSSNRAYTIIIAIVLLTLIAFVAKMMDKYQKESRVSKSDIPGVENPVVPGSDTTTTTLPMSSSTPDTEGMAASTSTDSTTTTLAMNGGGLSEGTTSTTLAAQASGSHPPLSSPTTSTSSTSSTTTLKATSAIAPLVSTTTTLPKPVTTSTVSSTTTTVTSTTSTTTTLRTSPVQAPSASAVTSTTVPSSTTTTLKPLMTEVILEALNRVTIRFSLNAGQNWQNITLNPDQVHTFRSRTNVQLEISDGGAVNVIGNGRDRGVPGTIGKPIRLTYP